MMKQNLYCTLIVLLFNCICITNRQNTKVRRIGVNRAPVIIIYPCGPERLIDNVWNACFNYF